MKFAAWHFFFPLNESLPLYDGYRSCKYSTGTTIDRHGVEEPVPDSVMIIFHQTKAITNPYAEVEAVSKVVSERSIRSAQSDSAFPLGPGPMAYTVAEVVVSQKYRSTRIVPNEDADELSDAIDYAIDELNVWLSAASLAGDQVFTKIRRETLPYSLPIAEGAYEPWELEAVEKLPRIKTQAVMMLNHNFGRLADHLPHSHDLDQRLDAALATISVQGPFSTFQDLRAEAQQQQSKNGDYRVAIILYASACESLFEELLQHLLWEQNMKPHEAAALFLREDKTPLGIASLVKNRLYSKLTERKYPKKGNGVISNWQEDIADIRNNVIHAGYRPSTEELHKCQLAFSSLIGYLADQLFVIRRKFPITALAFLGQVGLEKRNGWEGFDELEVSLEAVMQRLRAFRRWSDLVNAHRQSPNLMGKKVVPETAYAFLVYEHGEATTAYAVHKSKAFAAQLDLEEVKNDPAFRMALQSKLGDSGRDRHAVMYPELGGFEVPRQTKYDKYAYEVIPWDCFNFDDLAKNIGYCLPILPEDCRS